MIFGAGALAQRRAEVLERCASLRAAIAESAAPIVDKALLAERIAGAVPWLARALVVYSVLRKVASRKSA